MSWSSADFPHEDDQAYRHEHSLVDLSQSQAQPFPYIPLNPGWGWNGGARPGSISAQSAQHPVTSSLVIPTVNESISWDAPPSTYGTYSTLTSIQNHTPNPGLSYLPDSKAANFSHTGYLSPLSPHMEPTRQENHEQNICNRDVRRPIVGTRRHAHSQATNKNTRRPQQSREGRTVFPIRCQWDGCRYPGSFKRESSLVRHLRNIHFAPGAHPCPVQDCDMVCNRADNLMQHMRNIHD